MFIWGILWKLKKKSEVALKSRLQKKEDILKILKANVGTNVIKE